MAISSAVLLLAVSLLLILLLAAGIALVLVVQRRRAVRSSPRACPFCGEELSDAPATECRFCLRSFSVDPREEEELLGRLAVDGRARLVALEGALKGRDFVLDREAVIGRAGECAVSLDPDDLTASRRHARVHLDGGDYIIEDMGSTNGVYVNYNRVSAALLHDRDLIRTGRNLFSFCAPRSAQAEEDAIPLALPYDLGGLKLVERIGAGGSMVVYRAVRTADGSAVAVKVPRPRMLANTKFVERARREVEILTSFDHPKIMKIHELVQTESFFYIVMELLEGRLLRKVMQAAGKPAPIGKAVRIALQILEGLDYAHARGVVHRDIKPENIMVGDALDVKIMDFGIARRQDSYDITRAGTLLGTTFYMSTEQAKGLPADERSDLYSVGVLIYELLTGFVPFSGEWTDVICQHIQRQPTPPRQLNPRISPELEAVVLKALAKEPDERCATAREMVQELGACLGPGREAS